jgi:hypothetical protein
MTLCTLVHPVHPVHPTDLIGTLPVEKKEIE